MKLFNQKFLLVALLFSFTSILSLAQTKDSLYVSALPPGNLNNIINADTTQSGDTRHIYVLSSDTTYFLREEIRSKGLEIRRFDNGFGGSAYNE